MKRIIILIFMISISAIAQKGKFSGTVSYPIPLGDNYVKENYTGTLDIGAQYRFAASEFLNFGVSTNVGFYEFENENFTTQPDINARFIQPRLFGELHVGRVRVQVGGGYSFATFSTENALEPGRTEKVRDNTNGPNANVAVSLDIVKGLFVMAQYDYIRISAFGSLADTDFNEQVNLVKVGLGYRL